MTPTWVHVASTIGFTVLMVCSVVLLVALTTIYAHMLTPKAPPPTLTWDADKVAAEIAARRIATRDAAFYALMVDECNRIQNTNEEDAV